MRESGAFIPCRNVPILLCETVLAGHNVTARRESGVVDALASAVGGFGDLLVAVGRHRDRSAFVRIFEHYAPRVKSFLMKGGLTPEQADEVAQDTMLTVWQKAPAYDPQRASAGTWIFTIARNKRIDLQRKGWRDLPLPEGVEFPSSAPAVDTRMGEAQDSAALAAAVRGLPPEQAELIRKAYLEDKTHSDIAAETGLPLGTVKSRIRLALGKLRATMGDRKGP